MNNPFAFPRPGFDGASEDVENAYRNRPEDGMTLRDYFAAKAMVGILSSPKSFGTGTPITEQQIAVGAYVIADAMLAERTKEAAP